MVLAPLALLFLSASAHLPDVRVVPPSGVETVAHYDALGDAREAFNKANRKRQSSRIRNQQAEQAAETALVALVTLGKPAALVDLQGEFARCSIALRSHRDEAHRLRYAIEHRQRMHEMMKLRAEKDDTLEGTVRTGLEKIEELRLDLRKATNGIERESPWRIILTKATRALFEAVGNSKQRSLEKSLLKEAADSIKLADKVIAEAAENSTNGEAVRGRSKLPNCLAIVEMLGQVGGDGAALKIQGLMVDVGKRIPKMRREVRKAEVEVREMERRLQNAQERSGGSHPASLEQQYNRVKIVATQLRIRLAESGYIMDACVEAAGEALSRESGDSLQKSLTGLEKAFRSAKDDLRLRTLHILGRVGTDGVRQRLHAILAKEKEGAAIAQTLTDLSLLGDTSIIKPIGATYLNHDSWHVRSKAVEALATLRKAAGIPILIAILAQEEGRLRTDARNALVELSGMKFHANHELWQRWWKDNGDGFQVPDKPDAAEEASAMAKEGIGVTFFGITTESQRVLFILDLSGSMNNSMVDRGKDEANGDGRPQDGEISRLTAAKRNLIKAIGGLRDGARFNLVLYASDIWVWMEGDDEDVSDKRVARGSARASKLIDMEPETREALLSYIGSLEANGGTNIHGALQQAFEMAGVKEGDNGEWSKPDIDTIFFLSDGNPSVGVTIDADEILAFVRDLNASAGIVIHTIGLSGAHNAYLMRSLAEQNGGTYASN